MSKNCWATGAAVVGVGCTLFFGVDVYSKLESNRKGTHYAWKEVHKLQDRNHQLREQVNKLETKLNWAGDKFDAIDYALAELKERVEK